MNDTSRLMSRIIGELYNNDDLFKLLCIDTSDALDKPNLSDDQKEVALKGETDTRRILKTSFKDGYSNLMKTQLRIYKDIVPEKKGLAKIYFYFEIVTHKDNWELNNGEERVDKILFELLKSLNNKEINGIGYLDFNNPVKNVSWSENYNGYILMGSSRITW